MKDKKLYALFGLAFAVTLGACSDDEIIKSSPADAGQEVNFGAQLDRTKSRTHYGDKDIENNAFPIYWNTEAQGLDKIFISAPNAQTGRNQAFFTVHPKDDQTAPAAVVKIGDTGIQWGDKPTKFYGFYPGNENFNLSATGTTITATLPGDQTVTFVDQLNPDNNAQGYEYKTNPDMSCVMMVSKTASIAPTNDAIGLQFEPLSTVIDVTVSGPTETNSVIPYHVTSVSLFSENAAICGKFTYDYESGKIKTEPAAGDSMITVRTMAIDSKGDYVGVPLYNGQTMNLKISMLPLTDIENLDLKVRVTTADSKVWTKRLTTTHLAPGQINPVVLPKLIASEAKLDYSRWLSQLDPRIYISELSLPGSALSFNIKGFVTQTNEANITQWGSLDQQFNAGVRVFQSNCWIKDGTGADGQNGQFYLTTSNGTDTGITLIHALDRLQNEMEKSHTHGFCVLLLSDWNIGNNWTLAQFYSRFKAVTQRLQERGLLAPDITSTTTINDVKGKIILKLQLNGRDILTGTSGTSGTNSTLRNLQTCWKELAISGTEQTKALFNWWSQAAADNVFYAPMTFGTIGEFTFTDAEAGFSYTKAQITEVRPGIAVEAARKLADNAAWGSRGTLSCATKPTDMSNGLWFIYTDEGNAGANYTAFQSNIDNMCDAIVDCYTGTLYNKFFMTEVGGAGNATNSSIKIKNECNKKWLNKIGPDFGNRPLGWVLFNDVTDSDKTADKGYLTQDCITRVIEQNTKNGFNLQRDRTQQITPVAAPSGDVKGTQSGGSLFK